MTQLSAFRTFFEALGPYHDHSTDNACETLIESESGDLERLEIIEANGNEVEFKLHCKRGVLHERSVMEEDEKYGWIYSGESKMDAWE